MWPFLLGFLTTAFIFLVAVIVGGFALFVVYYLLKWILSFFDLDEII